MKTEQPEKVKELLRKVYELSKRGVDGEAAAAKRKLHLLLEKYDMNIDDVVGKDTKIYEFRYANKTEKSLILQCYVSILPQGDKRDMYKVKRKGRTMRVVAVKLTPSQFLDLSLMVAWYKAALKKEYKLFFLAFINRHKLFPNEKTDESSCQKLTDEEIEMLVRMMSGFSCESFLRAKGFLANGQ